MNSISHKKVVLVTHYRIYSAAQALRDYLRLNKYNKLLYISHPLPLKNIEKTEKSYFEISRGNDVKKKFTARRKFYNLVLSTFYEMYLTFKWVVGSSDTYDLYIGVDNLNAFYGLIFKKIGRVKKVVYYTIDYFPTRFENKFLNWIYHSIDKICVRYADETWNVSSAMIEAREKHNAMKRKNYNRQYAVPIGIWYDKAPRKNFSQIDKHKLIFVGHLLAHMGVDLAIKSMPEILKKIPDAKLEIVGGGEEEDKLEKLAVKLGISNSVKFWGWIRDRGKLEKIMSDGAVGLATFNTEILDDKVKNADPGKIKDYMLLGMPVIATDAISTADVIEEAKCGIIIRYNTSDLVDSVVKLLDNSETLKEYRGNALKYVRQFDYNGIFSKNLSRVLVNN